MDYLLTFLEGIITFISPCLLPMLPIYLSYFAGHNRAEENRNTIRNALGFILGFTIIFVLLGTAAGGLGYYLREYNSVINVIFGLILILFGLNFMDLIHIPFLNHTVQVNIKIEKFSFFTAMVLGIIFAVSWTPCVGVFLGSALLLAAGHGESFKGALMLLCFSAGLGIPFLVSAVLLERLETTFDFIKRNYRIINWISGGFLVVMGIFMMLGWLGYFLNLIAF